MLHIIKTSLFKVNLFCRDSEVYQANLNILVKLVVTVVDLEKKIGQSKIKLN